MKTADIAKLLAGCSESVCRMLMPNGEKIENDWCVGDIKGSKGKSLRIALSGDSAGAWLDFAGDDSGNLVTLWERVHGLNEDQACREAEEWLGILGSDKRTATHWEKIQKTMRRGTPAELDQLATLRRLSIDALKLATDAGQLYFDQVFDNDREHHAWIVTDSTKRNAQARRMDGQLWEKYQVKAKTLQGSKASWPLGISDSKGHDIALVEGGPDLLAAWHCISILGLKEKIFPVAMLGAGNYIPDEALPLFAGKRVHIVQHGDDAGSIAGNRWTGQLLQSAVQIEDLSGQKDLNDLIIACVGDENEIPIALGKIFEKQDVGMPVQIAEEENWDQVPAIESKVTPKKESDEDKYERLIRDTLYRNEVIIPKPVPIFTAAGTTICTPGNLTAYYSQAKAGKTAIIGAMLGATMELPGAVNDTLGFKGSNVEGKVVIHFDTEQSRYDWQQMLRTAMRRAKVDTPPPWLKSHILTGLTAGECRNVADRVIERYAKEFGGVYAVFFDGIADLVTDVNDPTQGNELIAHLHGSAIRHNTAIINVLHMNAGNESEKGRGHLGSQLERKAESNITMEKVDGVSSYWGIKQRGKAIAKDGAPSFQWSDESGMHVSCEGSEPKKKSKGGSEKVFHFGQFTEVFHRDRNRAMNRSMSYRYAKEHADISDSKWRDLLNEAVKNGELVRSDGGVLGYLYQLPPV